MDNECKDLVSNLPKLKKVLYRMGWYCLSFNLDKPERRGIPYQKEWTEELLKDYLLFHCGEEMYLKIVENFEDPNVLVN